MKETRVWSLGQENPLEKWMATHSSILAWKIPWTEEPGRLQSVGSLSNFPFTFHFHALEKEMATHSSVIAWRIPGTEEPGGLLSMGSHRVGHDWSDLAAAAASTRCPTGYKSQRLLKSVLKCIIMRQYSGLPRTETCILTVPQEWDQGPQKQTFKLMKDILF